MAHKLSWSLFVFIGAIGTLMGVRVLIEPAALLPLLQSAGPSTAPLAGPEATALAAFLGRWVATALLGGNVLTVVVALTALRRQEPWAAWLMLYWPLMFASHFFMYAPGPMRVVQVVWFCASTAAILVLVRASRASTSRAPGHAEAALA